MWKYSHTSTGHLFLFFYSFHSTLSCFPKLVFFYFSVCLVFVLLFFTLMTLLWKSLLLSHMWTVSDEAAKLTCHLASGKEDETKQEVEVSGNLIENQFKCLIIFFLN